MQRFAHSHLQDWFSLTNRKPLVIRGARQVGKTWLVRDFTKSIGKQLIELNMEQRPQLAHFFESNDPQKILFSLSTALDQAINIEHSLLFIDEIQETPELIAKLRWFSENLPQLPVIAAGSLLELIFGKQTFSMPVGRISYFYMEPLSFEEFLLANNKKILYEYLTTYRWENNIPPPLHTQFMALFQEYLIVGGLPAAIVSWESKRSLAEVNQIHRDILSAYRDDFKQYSHHIDAEKLDAVILTIPQLLGKKFVYSHTNLSLSTYTVKEILSLLNKIKICSKVVSCHANGLPLGAEINAKYFKEIFLDVGLVCTALNLTLHHINDPAGILLSNKGAIAEQVVGQLLRTLEPFYVEPRLYYWLRTEKSSNAEVDYIISHGNKIIPIEVKSGSSGSLKSLHLLMGLKNLDQAVRVNGDVPSKTSVKVKDHHGNKIEYTLLSIPFYLTGQIHRLLDDIDH